MYRTQRAITPFAATLAAGLFAGLFSIAGCKSAPTAPDQPADLKVKTHVAGDAGFAVSSHLISGDRDAVLIDAQMTRSEATKLAEMIQGSGRNLTTIFITHAHPDHFGGLETLKQKFPAARVVSTRKVVDAIQKGGKGMLDYWKPQYKEDISDKLVVPEVVDGTELTLEGRKLQIVELGAGESEASAAIFIPSLRTVATGDHVYNDVHLWLAEGRPEAWLKNLETLKGLGQIDAILPGHGDKGDVQLIARNEQYIRDFMAATQGKKARKKTATDTIKKKYSGYKLPIIAELSVGAKLKK